MAEQITDADFAKVLEDSHKTPVLVDFWAPWCGPCRAVAPVLDELSKEYEGRVRICKMNVDENSITPQKYGVRAIPTMVLIKNGATVEQITGAQPKQALVQLLDTRALA